MNSHKALAGRASRSPRAEIWCCITQKDGAWLRLPPSAGAGLAKPRYPLIGSLRSTPEEVPTRSRLFPSTNPTPEPIPSASQTHQQRGRGSRVICRVLQSLPRTGTLQTCTYVYNQYIIHIHTYMNVLSTILLPYTALMVRLVLKASF